MFRKKEEAQVRGSKAFVTPRLSVCTGVPVHYLLHRSSALPSPRTRDQLGADVGIRLFQNGHVAEALCFKNGNTKDLQQGAARACTGGGGGEQTSMPRVHRVLVRAMLSGKVVRDTDKTRGLKEKQLVRSTAVVAEKASGI